MLAAGSLQGAAVLTGGVRLTDDQRLDWLRLIRSDNIGPRGIMAQTPQGRGGRSRHD